MDVRGGIGRTLNSNSTMKFDTLTGIRLHNHPFSDALSCVNRTCLLVFYNHPSVSHYAHVLVLRSVLGQPRSMCEQGTGSTDNDGIPAEIPPSVL